MKNMVMFAGLLTATSAQSSTPQGSKHGPWHVISISSMSGTEGNDASAMITQEVNGDELTVRWQEGGRIVLSVNINECSANEEFDQSYAVPIDTWQMLSNRAIGRHLQKTFSVWIEQAKLACPQRESVAKFQLGSLTGATDDFNRRLNYFHPEKQSALLDN